jgi:hypothetical protein
MAGVHIPVTAAMVDAAYEVLATSYGETASDDVRKALEAALKAAEISMGDTGPATVELTFIDHNKDAERVTITAGGKGHDFGPRGLAFRRVTAVVR